jgi:hypothetical protein
VPHHDPGHVEGVEDPAAAGIRPMNSTIIFGLLIVLMLTDMPISIALGLTVLSFLFVMTTVPIGAVALKLFTGIEASRSWPSRSSFWPAISSPTAVSPAA